MTRDEMDDASWAFWQFFQEGRMDEAFALLHPDYVYTSIYGTPLDGEFAPIDQVNLEAFMRGIDDTMTIRFERGYAIVEGDRVVQRFRGDYEIPGDAQVYDQYYCMLHTFRDGKIFRIEEWLDTKKEDALVAYLAQQFAARAAATGV